MADKAAKKKNGKKDGLGTGAKVVIVLFAVLMALSLMLPSLAAVFSSLAGGSSSDSGQASSEQSSDSSSGDSSSDSDSGSDASSDDQSSSDSSSTNSNVVQADEKYGALVDELKGRYDSDPQNLATLLNLGKDYMTWGVYARYYGSTDADTSHANELLSNAVKYYDEYLALHDSNAVRVDRALCAFYSEDQDSALQQLEDLTSQAPDYGPAWANLGMLYEAKGDSDSARSAYAKAQETDPNDEYGAKSYATQRLNSLDSASSQSSGGSGDSANSTGTTSTGAQGLSQTLGSLSGTGL